MDTEPVGLCYKGRILVRGEIVNVFQEVATPPKGCFVITPDPWAPRVRATTDNGMLSYPLIAVSRGEWRELTAEERCECSD